MTKKPHKKGLVVEVRDGNISSALKKFKRKVDDSNKLIDIVKNSHYEKPTTERKRKKGAARARWLKKLEAQSLPKKQF
jgi:small subunit ribosomal protein S21